MPRFGGGGDDDEEQEEEPDAAGGLAKRSAPSEELLAGDGTSGLAARKDDDATWCAALRFRDGRVVCWTSVKNDSARISERTSSRRPSTSSYQFAAEDDDGGDALLRSLYDDGDAALPSDGG